MNPGKPPNPFLFALYRSSLRLYPWRLRLLYQDQLLQTARDAYAGSTSSLYFWPSLFADLLKSAMKEHLLMIRDQVIELRRQLAGDDEGIAFLTGRRPAPPAK